MKDGDAVSNWLKLAPYLFLLLVMGFGWFIIAPIVPQLGSALGVGMGQVMVLVSLYGYALIVLSLPAGWLSAKINIKRLLYISSAISAVGLIGRAFFWDYTSFLVMSSIAAIAFPLATAPIGSIAKALFRDKSHSVIGVSLGTLFLGMGMGSLSGPWMYATIGIRGALWVAAILSILAALWIFLGVRDYPEYGKSLRKVFRPGMVKNWYVGFAIPAISVLFGSVVTTVLMLHDIPDSTAVAYGGLLGGLIFVGAASGSITLPLLFERSNKVRMGMVLLAVMMFVSLAAMVLSLSYTTMLAVIGIAYFFTGFFGNAYVSMAMASTTHYVSNPSQAGFVTSMFNVFTGLGMAIIPMFLGVEFGSLSTIGIGVIVMLAIELITVFLSPFLRTTDVTSASTKRHKR